MFSFERRQQQIEVSLLLRRLTDIGSISHPSSGEDCRAENRHNQSCPALLVAWEDGTFQDDECVCAITKDLSDSGISLVLQQPFRADEAVVGLWPALNNRRNAFEPQPFFLLGRVRQNVDIGGGFWQLGLSLTRVLSDKRQIGRLMPLAARLLPKSRVKQMSADKTVYETLRR